MIVVIDRDWFDARTVSGARRIDESQDWVRREIATALQRNITIIPLLVNDAHMPDPRDLPDEIRGLGYCTALKIRDRNRDLPRDLRDLRSRLRKSRIRYRRSRYMLPIIPLATIMAVLPAFLTAPAAVKHTPRASNRPSLLGNAEGLTVANGSVWVTGAASGVVTRIDTTSMKTIATIPVGMQPLRITSGFGAIWVGNGVSGNVARIDPSTNNVSNTIPIGHQAGGGLAAAFGRIWVSDYGTGSISEIDPTIEKVTMTLKIGGRPLGVTSGDGQIWVVDSSGDKLIGVAPDSLRVTTQLGLCKFPQTVVFYAGYAWATCTDGHSVDRVSA